MGKMIEKWQIARVHMLKKEAGLSDGDYRALLGGWDVESSKDLDFGEANEVIRALERMVPGQGRGSGGMKYDDLRGRRGMASPAQLRMLEAMWKDVSVFDDPKRRHEAWLRFLRNRFDRVMPEHIEATMVQRIRSALEGMRDAGKE